MALAAARDAGVPLVDGGTYAAMHLEDFSRHAGTLEGLRGYLYDKYVHRHAAARAEAAQGSQLSVAHGG